MSKKEYTNDVLSANSGLHSIKAMKMVEQVLTTHDLKQAILYQFILSGSPSKPEYQATIKALVRHIRTKCRAEYIGAYEVGAEKNGLHCHLYILVETAHHFPSDLLDVSEGGFIARRIKRTGMSIRIEPPKNRRHRGQMFARMNTPELLADCITWVSYATKSRSKEGVPGRETYFGSEFTSNIAKREAQRQKHRDALTKSTIPPSAGSPAAETKLTKEHHESSFTAPQEAGNPASQGNPASSASREALVCTRRPASSSEEAGTQGRAEGNTDPERYGSSSPGAHHQAEGVVTGEDCSDPWADEPASIASQQTYSANTEKVIDPVAPRCSPDGLKLEEGEMTPADKYIASRYECAVDSGMDVAQIRAYLLAHGIRRTQAQVVDDLDNAYGFFRYAERHPAPPTDDVAAFDDLVDLDPDRSSSPKPVRS
jgi:hypothetical protein